MNLLTRSTYARLVIFAVLGLFATACLGSDSGSDEAEEGTEGDAAGTEAAAGGDEGGGGGGEEVEIFGGFVDAEADLFDESLQPFRDETGINVVYNGVPDFDTLITTRIQGDDLPTIALFPQPGLLLDVADQTDALPVSDYLDLEALEGSLIPGFLDAATDADGNVMGFPMRMAIKSALWYPIPEFEEAGYAIPETQDDLAALEEQIVSDGNVPWCIGMGTADWVGTDWVEEYMLRLHGPEVYDQWISHEVLFDSPEVRAAFEAFAERFAGDNVEGGTQGMLSIPFGESPNSLFTDPPGCFMHRQGNFIAGFFPDDVQETIDENVGVAYFPSGGGYDGNPVLAGGDLALMLEDSEDARAVMEFIATDTFGAPWAQAGGWLSPHVGFDTSNYSTEVERSLAEIGTSADVLRFDGSDLMPGAVGTGSFWTGMADFVGGQSSLDEVVAAIDASWPD